VAPSLRRAIFLRSGALGGGFYSLYDWDFESDRVQTVLSLRESDPGSGRSFEYAWSSDSKAVRISGRTGGFARRGGAPRSLDLLYLVDGSVYEIQ
jgi:hypothetical protein